MSKSVDISWMIRRDQEQVLQIEQACYSSPLDEAHLVKTLREYSVIGMVARLYGFPNSVDGLTIGGHMIYRLHKKRIELLRLAVDPARRRQGIGTAMIDKLKSKMTPQGRNRLTVEVRESNLDACMFFNRQRLWATSVRRAAFEDTGEDAYLFNWRCLKEQAITE